MSKVYVTYSKDDNSTTGVYATQFGAIKAAKENGYGHGIDFFELVGREELDWESLKAAFDTVISTAPEAIKNAYESEDFKKAINELRNASSTNKGIEYFIVTNYKTKREADIISYADTDDRIIILEEDE